MPTGQAKTGAVVRINDSHGNCSQYEEGKIQVIRFGRDSNWADVVLPEELSEKGVGRQHCELEFGPGCLQLDTNGQGAVWLGGKRVYDQQNLPRNCTISFVEGETSATFDIEYIPISTLAETVHITAPEKSPFTTGKYALGLAGAALVAALTSFVIWFQNDDIQISEQTLQGVFSVQNTKPGEVDGELTPIATAWLAPGGVVVTNRHVAESVDFSITNGASAYLRVPPTEAGVDGTLIRIIGVTYHPGLTRFQNYLSSIPPIKFQAQQLYLRPYDLAALHVERIPDHIKPLELAQAEEIAAMHRGQPLAIAGYPNKVNRTEFDKTRPIPIIEYGAFYGRAGFAQQQGEKATSPFMAYDIETWGGNSGGPVFNADGKVVAVHFSGSKEMRNGKAVSSAGKSYGQNLRFLHQMLKQESGDKINWQAEQEIWSGWTSDLPTIEASKVALIDAQSEPTANMCKASFTYDWDTAPFMWGQKIRRRFDALEMPLPVSGKYYVYAQSLKRGHCPAKSGKISGCLQATVDTPETSFSISEDMRKTFLDFEFDHISRSSNGALTTAGGQREMIEMVIGGGHSGDSLRINIYVWSKGVCAGEIFAER